MTTSVVLLNGTPSAGKTTLARALHERTEEPTFYQSLDEFRGAVADRFWTTDRVPALFPTMVRAYLRMLAAVADEGIPVIAEAVVLPDNRAWYDPLLERFDVALVGVRCPLPVAQQRELGRPDRRNGPIELDVAEFDLVHQQDYLLEVDTSVEPTAVSVDRIRAAVTNRVARTRPATR